MTLLRNIYTVLYYDRYIDGLMPELERGNFPLTKIVSEKLRVIINPYETSAVSGKVQILKWLRISDGKQEKPHRWDTWICVVAAKAGHIRVLKWLRTRDYKYRTPCRWDNYTCQYAAAEGHFELLKWLRTPDEKYGTPCPWGRYTYIYAKTEEIKDWLIDNGFPRE